MDNEINGFDEGVATGGLRNTTQIKILFEYLADSLDGEADKDTLIQAVLMHSLVNYFEASQALDELTGNGNIEKTESGTLVITDKGKANLDELLPDLPFSVREIAFSDARMIQKREKLRNSNNASVVKTENGYETVWNINRGGERLISVSLRAPDYQTALELAQKFDEDPEKYYSRIVSVFYDEEEGGNA